MIKNVSWSSCTVSVILVRFQWNLDFLDSFSKYAKISNFIEIRAVGAELFHADGRTDMTKLIVAFRNFANAPQNSNTKFSVKWKNVDVLVTEYHNHYRHPALLEDNQLR